MTAVWGDEHCGHAMPTGCESFLENRTGLCALFRRHTPAVINVLATQAATLQSLMQGMIIRHDTCKLTRDSCNRADILVGVCVYDQIDTFKGLLSVAPALTAGLPGLPPLLNSQQDAGAGRTAGHRLADRRCMKWSGVHTVPLGPAP